MLSHQLHQTGFPATPDASDDFDHIGVLKRNHPIQVEIAIFQTKLAHQFHRLLISISQYYPDYKKYYINETKNIGNCSVRLLFEQFQTPDFVHGASVL